MKIQTSDKVIAYLTLISGLTISAVAVWYSVAGLVSIFAATVIPIIVMGVALEVSKLVATVWLKLNWHRAPKLIKIYLTTAIAILMVITSMGIFGFLSKAHSDQSLVSGDVLSRIAIIDEKIATERSNIEAAKKAIAQMDASVDQTMSRSTNEAGATRAAQLRKSQTKERASLQAEITKSQKAIATLNDEAAPIRAEVRKVEAEVGPIKYIAAFVYGSNPDANILEKAVTWVIIIIVSVFDPLAVILLLASQYSFQWFRQQDEEELPAETTEPEKTDEELEEEVKEFFEKGRLVARELDREEQERLVNEANDKLSEIEKEEPTLESVGVDVDYTVVDDADEEVIEEVTVAVETVDDDEIDENELPHIKAAKTAWKNDHPNDSLKHQRKLLEDGVIKQLPWELPPYTVPADLERPGDYLSDSDIKTVAWLEKEGSKQVRHEIKGYEQNAEQSSDTLWQRIQATKE